MSAQPLPLAFRPLAAAQMLSICKTTLYRMIKDGQITPIEIRGHRRIPRAEIERILGAPIPQPAAEIKSGSDNIVWLG
jgi:excisionase family DNA binding protein